MKLSLSNEAILFAFASIAEERGPITTSMAAEALRPLSDEEVIEMYDEANRRISALIYGRPLPLAPLWPRKALTDEAEQS